MATRRIPPVVGSSDEVWRKRRERTRKRDRKSHHWSLKVFGCMNARVTISRDTLSSHVVSFLARFSRRAAELCSEDARARSPLSLSLSFHRCRGGFCTRVYADVWAHAFLSLFCSLALRCAVVARGQLEIVPNNRGTRALHTARVVHSYRGVDCRSLPPHTAPREIFFCACVHGASVRALRGPRHEIRNASNSRRLVARCIFPPPAHLVRSSVREDSRKRRRGDSRIGKTIRGEESALRDFLRPNSSPTSEFASRRRKFSNVLRERIHGERDGAFSLPLSTWSSVREESALRDFLRPDSSSISEFASRRRTFSEVLRERVHGNNVAR